MMHCGMDRTEQVDLSPFPLSWVPFVPRSVAWRAAMMTFFTLAGPLPLLAQAPNLLRVSNGKIGMVSDAPMERIEANTTEATGVLDLAARSFAMQIPVKSFSGFNSPLQQEHFNENYLQSDKYPFAVFKGRIIEAVDLTKPGTYRVRAKGSLSIHGVDQERIIECVLVVNAEGVRVKSVFDVVLVDHDIRVPRVVQQKIDPRIEVTVDVLFTSGSLPKK
jgi:YceI-like domain